MVTARIAYMRVAQTSGERVTPVFHDFDINGSPLRAAACDEGRAVGVPGETSVAAHCLGLGKNLNRNSNCEERYYRGGKVSTGVGERSGSRGMGALFVGVNAAGRDGAA
jgi:hypothetical protein